MDKNTYARINGLMDELSNLIRDSSVEQRQQAMRTLHAADLVSDWFARFPRSRAGAGLTNAIAAGNISGWVGDQFEIQVGPTGIWTLIKQRGPGALSYSGLASGAAVPEGEVAARAKVAIAILETAIRALVSAGVVNQGVTETDRAFRACGGSVSSL